MAVEDIIAASLSHFGHALFTTATFKKATFGSGLTFCGVY